MRILHVASEYPPIQVFGLGRAVHDLAVAQAALGDEVHVVTNSTGGADQETVMDGVHVHRVDSPPPPKPPDDVMAVIQFNTSALETASRTADRAGVPDVVHVHDWLTALPGRALKWLYPQARLACTMHDTAVGKHFGHLEPWQAYKAELESWIGKEADLVICCSQHVRGEMMQHYGCPADKIKVIPCGVDEGRFKVEGDLESFRTMFAAPEDRLALYIGRLDPEKGLDVLVNAMAQVVAIEPRAKLLLVGKGQLQPTIAEHVRGLNIGSRVHFAGYLTSNVLAAVLRLADVLVVPSLYEPFGIVALEGMISHTPVIVSDTGGLSEIVSDGESGLKVPPRDVPSLARGIVRMLNDEGLRRRIGQGGYARASGHYKWHGIAEQTKVAYAGN